MATGSRASQAVLFMQRCRNSQSSKFYQRWSSTDAAPYSPGNFNRPLRSPITPTAEFAHRYAAPSNLEEKEPIQRPDREIKLPEWARPMAQSQPVLPQTKPSWTTRVRKRLGLAVFESDRATFPYNVYNNPYRARKQWPPDFKDTHPLQQFHFEKTYRRRAVKKWDRPEWKRWTKLVQNGLIIFVIVYFWFIRDPEDFGGGNPAWSVQAWLYGHLKDWTILPDGVRSNAAATEKEMRMRNEIRRKMREEIPLTDEEDKKMKGLQH